MKIYIDEKLKKYVVPTELRDNSKFDGKIFTSGTRIPLPEDTKFIRMFSAWATKDGEEARIDLDLGALFITKENKIERIAYYNQSEEFAVHSGDFTSCRAFNKEDGKITAEFIDIDIERAKETMKYAVISNIIYGGVVETFSEFDAWSGVQILDKFRTEKTEYININYALTKMNLHGEYRSQIPFAIDFETNELVLIDKYSEDYQGANVDSIAGKMEEFKKQYFNALDYKENMYRLLELYSKAKEYTLVTNKEDADIICSYDDCSLVEGQTMFNISNNLDEILNLLK